MQEIARRTWWLLTAVVMAIVVITTTIYAGDLGFWEPWESVNIRIGVDGADVVEVDDTIGSEEAIDDQETPDIDEDGGDTDDERAQIDSAAVPTLDGKPVFSSWIKSKWTEIAVEPTPVVESGGIGDMERQTRLPLLALAVLLLGTAALWVRRHLGEGPAAMTVVVLATSPVFYLGAIFLSAPLVYMAASALAVMAFFHSVYGHKKWRFAWALAGGAALAVVALDERIIGVFSTVAVVVALAIAQAVSDRSPNREEKTLGAGLDPVWGIGAIVVFAASIGWAWNQSRGYEDGLLRPDIVQQLWLIGPTVLLVGMAMAARRTPVGQALTDLRGAFFIAGATIPLLLLGTSYAAAVPIDPALAEQGSPALSYLLENQAFGGEVAAQGDFAWWWRQLGFGLFPHLIFLLPALGYLAWKLRPEANTDPAQAALAILCLVWPVAAFVVVAPAATLGHTVYPAFFPLILAIGWMASDSEFWKTLRLRPALYLVVAVMAIFMIMILTKDLENFPSRLIEFVLGGAEASELDEDFAYGSALSRWKYAIVAAIGAYFAGLISWLVFSWRDAKRLWNWLKGLWPRFCKWRSGEKRQGRDQHRQINSPGTERMAEREAWRDKDSWLSQLARRMERLPGLVAIILIAGLGFMAANLGSFIDDLDDELSSRAVIEAYLDASEEGEPLWRYQIDEEGKHFYVRGLEEISDRRAFNERYGADERYFALINADDLASIHSHVRREHAENLPVLAIGGGMYLISNVLRDDELDINPISDFIVDEPDDDYIPLLVEADGEMVHPDFSNQIEFLGYKFDRGSADQPPVYSWGDTIELTMYFNVKRRIPRAQDIFMHIDLAGNRIHGDHEPLGGLYPTNHWLAGDIIKNVHHINVERFSTPGTYTIWTGFYRGDNRMNVEPEDAHDGQDRVNITTIEVVPF